MRRPAALAVLPALLLAGCAGADPSASAASPSAETGQRIEVAVAEGEVSGDTGRVPVPLGEAVTLVVTSDTADEVHVHGYDISAPVTADRPATVTFAADVPGVFEVELHEAGTMLLTLQVG